MDIKDGRSPPLETPFSFSILVSAPIRRKIIFAPESALVFPLGTIKLPLATLIIIGADLFLTFLYKRSLVSYPRPDQCPSPDKNAVTLTMPQLIQLMQTTMNGSLSLPETPNPSPNPYNIIAFHPLTQYQIGVEEPLYEDSLTVNLFVASAFAPFDRSPSTNYNVPLFSLPGAPGNLIIVLGALIAQFFIEQSGVGTETPRTANPAGS